MFHGFVVPKEPKPPEPDGEFPASFHLELDNEGACLECCMSGCAVCVYDLYEDALLAYRASMEKAKQQGLVKGGS